MDADSLGGEDFKISQVLKIIFCGDDRLVEGDKAARRNWEKIVNLAKKLKVMKLKVKLRER